VRLPNEKRTVTLPTQLSVAGNRDEPLTLPLTVNVYGRLES
jgi:hypothetical protein